VSSEALPVADVLRDLGGALDAFGARWYLFGAQAAILYGVTRLTADVDVTVALGTRSSRELVAALSNRGFRLRVQDVGGFVESTRVLPLVHERSRLPVDVVLAGPGLEELFLERATTRQIGDASVPVAAPEDVIAMKILAGRPHDFDDVAAMVRARRDAIDLGAVRQTLRLLEQALDRADLVRELDRLAGS
jgi:hypothetical protein